MSNLTLLEHHHQLVNAVAVSENIPRGVRTLLTAIATYFNVNKQCAFPSRKQIALRTGYCMNHITDLIKQAVELGLIKSKAQYVQVEGESAPRQISNRYEFVLEAFGLFFSKAKMMLNRNLRKAGKTPVHQQLIPKSERAAPPEKPDFAQDYPNFLFTSDSIDSPPK